MRTPLAILIEGEQKLNTIILETITKLIPELEKFKANKKQVFKANGELRKNASHLKECITKGKRHDGTKYPLGYIDLSHGGSIRVNLKICLSGGSYGDHTHYCEYFERSIYLGKETSQGVTEVDTLEELIKAYGLTKEELNLDDQLKLVEQFKENKKELQLLLDQIDPKLRNHFYLTLR